MCTFKGSSGAAPGAAALPSEAGKRAQSSMRRSSSTACSKSAGSAQQRAVSPSAMTRKDALNILRWCSATAPSRVSAKATWPEAGSTAWRTRKATPARAAATSAARVSGCGSASALSAGPRGRAAA